MFNIITFADKKNGGWTAEEFFAHGEAEIDAAMKRLASLGLWHEGCPHGQALDFGCGIGRLTQALMTYYDWVYGVDISPEMIDRAEEYGRDKPAPSMSTRRTISRSSMTTRSILSTR